MLVSAEYRYANISSQKCRLVADLIRSKRLSEAESILVFTRKKAAKLLLKLIKSAAANAKHNYELNLDDLIVKSIYVNKGPAVKRMKPRARGRGNIIIKNYSHICVHLAKGDK